MKQRLIASGVVLIGAVTLAAAVAQAEPPGAASGAHGKPSQLGDKGKPDDKGKPGDKGKSELEHGKAEQEHGKGDGDGAKAGHRRGGPWRALLDDVKSGKVKKGELKDHLAKLRDSASERRGKHQGELKARWGSLLAMPPVREELEHHARRMARLNRAAFLAETEATKDKDKLVERIAKLIDKEEARHQRAMERFKSMPGAPAASVGAAPSALPAASAAPPAASGGVK